MEDNGYPIWEQYSSSVLNPSGKWWVRLGPFPADLRYMVEFPHDGGNRHTLFIEDGLPIDAIEVSGNWYFKRPDGVYLPGAIQFPASLKKLLEAAHALIRKVTNGYAWGIVTSTRHTLPCYIEVKWEGGVVNTFYLESQVRTLCEFTEKV